MYIGYTGVGSDENGIFVFRVLQTQIHNPLRSGQIAISLTVYYPGCMICVLCRLYDPCTYCPTRMICIILSRLYVPTGMFCVLSYLSDPCTVPPVWSVYFPISLTVYYPGCMICALSHPYDLRIVPPEFSVLSHRFDPCIVPHLYDLCIVPPVWSVYCPTRMTVYYPTCMICVLTHLMICALSQL